MAANKSKLLTVRIEEELHQQLRLATLSHETTMTEVVRAAILDWIKAHPESKAKAAAVAKAKPAKKEAAKKAAPKKAEVKKEAPKKEAPKKDAGKKAAAKKKKK